MAGSGEWAAGIIEGVRPVGAFFHRVEKWLTMFFANVVTLMLGMLIALMGLDRDVARTPRDLAIFVVAGGMWLALDVPYLWRVWRVAFEEGDGGDRKPYAYEVARRQKVLPVLLRPLVALWWLGHFAFGVAGALYTHTLSFEGEPVVVWILSFLMVTSYGFAANGYLMLGVCALTRSERVRERVWRMRGLIDIGLGVVGSMLPAAKGPRV